MTTFMQWIVPIPGTGRSSPAPTRGVARRSPTRCRNNDPVATASATQTPPRSPANRPNMVSVGTIVWLSSELMFFAALFAMYFTIRSVTGLSHWPPSDVHLNLPFASVNTFILVSSSFTCQAGVFAAERGDVAKLRLYFIITFLMGAMFVAGQATEYTQLTNEGTTMSSSAYGSIFFLATGFHGLHVSLGL